MDPDPDRELGGPKTCGSPTLVIGGGDPCPGEEQWRAGAPCGAHKRPRQPREQGAHGSCHRYQKIERPEYYWFHKMKLCFCE
jgi:hypothetical protein